MKKEVFIVNAFGLSEVGGNPAGVVLDADNLSESQMLAIAAKVGLSETAFLLKSDNCDFRLRFFTPIKEVDLCGHATIATYSLLFQLGKVSAGTYKQELLAGHLELTIDIDGRVSMEQSKPYFGEIFTSEKIASILKVDASEITFEKFPIKLVSTGLRDILVPISSRLKLDEISPCFASMAEFNKLTDSIGFHVFSFNNESLSPVAFCRNFAPLYEINEEAATGSSSGALACYLYKYGLKVKHFEFHQGFSMNRPSKILVDLDYSNDDISKVVVSGYAGKPSKSSVTY